jgi:hypothetical protein
MGTECYASIGEMESETYVSNGKAYASIESVGESLCFHRRKTMVEQG